MQKSRDLSYGKIVLDKIKHNVFVIIFLTKPLQPYLIHTYIHIQSSFLHFFTSIFKLYPRTWRTLRSFGGIVHNFIYILWVHGLFLLWTMARGISGTTHVVCFIGWRPLCSRSARDVNMLQSFLSILLCAVVIVICVPTYQICLQVLLTLISNLTTAITTALQCGFHVKWRKFLIVNPQVSFQMNIYMLVIILF